MVKLGIIGLSPENGHPYSLSAIINGYSHDPRHWKNWPVIFDYLNLRQPSEIASLDAKVTHVWTQTTNDSCAIAKACFIENIVSDLKDMIEKVDAVILARDDYENHRQMSELFLRAGLPVFIDKPLTLTASDIRFFRPYLKAGKLMSCSGLYFAKELQSIPIEIRKTAKFVSANVLNGWEKYGIHMIDAVQALIDYKVQSVYAKDAAVFSSTLTCENGTVIAINALGKTAKTFQIQVWSEQDHATIEISDNFSAFKATLVAFVNMIETGAPSVDPNWTLSAMKILLAGKRSAEEKREVQIDEIQF